MRAGLCAVPQALTSEAANIVKQAVNLARQRGHAQVTPLHVASAMLACPTGLLRRACTLHSHSHPLHCKALELCFNVALNRLPASTSSPLLLGSHYSPRPSLSNALVAAFKRAQAHQRRGSNENQQQPILALKIEVERLIISVLDDPSVSRVMREAGFSSSEVKSKVEENVPLDICSQSPVKSLVQVRNSDEVMSVLNTLVSKKRNIVIVGGCLASTEGVIRGIIDKFEGGQVPGDLRYARFISLPLSSLRNLCKAEIEQKLVELRRQCYVGRGIVLYLGDLIWVSEFWATYGEQKRNYYSFVDYIIMEIKRLVFEIGESERLWLIGIANFQTYMRCKAGHPSLEKMWKLHSFTIPVGSLSLSLNLDSDSQTHFTKVQRDGLNWPLLESWTQSMANSIQKKESAVAAAKSTMPSWLQQYKEESRRKSNIINDKDIFQKLNSFGNKQTDYPEKVVHFSSSSPSFVSVSSQECKQVPKEHQFWVSEISDDEEYESSLGKNSKPDILSNPNSSPNSASSSEAEEEHPDCFNSFKKLTNENLKILSEALESKVPWQKENIPEIARTILECRSGSSAQKQNKLKCREDEKEETWLLFLGADTQGKEKIAREIAKVVFGSQNNFSSIAMAQKRAIDELDCSYIERFGMALNENPHRVFFMEDLEQVDYCYQRGLKQAIENGRITLHDGENVPLKDSIIIFSCNSVDSLSRACSPNKRPKTGDDKEKDEVSLDLNIAIEDIEDEADHSVGDIRILESVDKQIIFKIQELW